MRWSRQTFPDSRKSTGLKAVCIPLDLELKLAAQCLLSVIMLILLLPHSSKGAQNLILLRQVLHG